MRRNIIQIIVVEAIWKSSERYRILFFNIFEHACQMTNKSLSPEHELAQKPWEIHMLAQVQSPTIFTRNDCK